MEMNPIPVNVNEVFGFSTEDNPKAEDERALFHPYGFCRSKNCYSFPCSIHILADFQIGNCWINHPVLDSRVFNCDYPRRRLLVYGFMASILL